MTASQAAKQAGFNSLKEVSIISTRSTQVLNYWFKHNRPFFDIVLMGCVQHAKNARHENWEKIVDSAQEKYKDVYKENVKALAEAARQTQDLQRNKLYQGLLQLKDEFDHTCFQDPFIAIDGGTLLEWWNGERKLTISPDGPGFHYIKVWGPNIFNDMEDGKLDESNYKDVWAWLMKEE